jgi:hypothetical protein
MFIQSDTTVTGRDQTSTGCRSSPSGGWNLPLDKGSAPRPCFVSGHVALRLNIDQKGAATAEALFSTLQLAEAGEVFP